MINADTKALEQSLEKAKQTIKQKLMKMVVDFGVKVAEAASNTTPVGDPESYPKLYELRLNTTGIPSDSGGYHAGAWVYSEDLGIKFTPVIYSRDEMLNDVLYEIETGYKLGDTFYIGATGPAFVSLDRYKRSQQAPEGIMKPTINLIESTYRINLKASYDKG